MLRNHLFKSPSPYINHFISADTIIPNPTDPQSWNRYSYVNNNPLRYTDPTGHMLDYGGNEGGGGCNSITCFPTHPNNTPSGGGGGSGGGSSSGNSGNNGGAPTSTTTPCYQALSACLSTPTSTPSPTGTSTPNTGPSYTNYSTTPTATPMFNNDPIPWEFWIPSPLSWPPDFAPNADDIWDILLGALPLINQPATSINQIVNNTVNTVISTTSYTLTNVGSAVNEAIGNGPNSGPVIPIFYLPPPDILFPTYFGEPVYN